MPASTGASTGIEGKARFLSADEEHFFADAGTDRIDRDERPAGRLAIGCERLHHQQRDPREVLVLVRRDDRADRRGRAACQVTGTVPRVSMMPTMAASTGKSFSPDAMRAELPLTMSTVSPTPASTVSTATR